MLPKAPSSPFARPRWTEQDARNALAAHRRTYWPCHLKPALRRRMAASAWRKLRPATPPPFPASRCRIEQLFRRATGAVTLLNDPRVSSADPLGPPLVQEGVADAILAALDDPAAAAAPLPFQINAGWMSPAQEYVLHHCHGAGAAAPAGASAHADGSAIDLAGPYADATTCGASVGQTDTPASLRDRAHPVWGALLEAHGLAWYGSAGSVCGDPPHFDDPATQSSDDQSAAIQAFQQLWNNNNPCDAIQESGVLDADTEARLALSPAAGFGPGADGVTILGGGVPGAGCPSDSGDPAKLTCCSDHACHDTQSEDDNCGSCGNSCPVTFTCEAGQCVCPPGTMLCGATCVDTTANVDNCGGCGLRCITPQPDTCESETIRVNYAPQGTCSGSTCHYAQSTEDCQSESAICCGGACIDPSTDPTTCCGVTCTKGDPDVCDDAGTAVVHEVTPGTCSLGKCSFQKTTIA